MKKIILIFIAVSVVSFLMGCIESTEVTVSFHFNNEEYEDYQITGFTGSKISEPNDPEMDNYFFAGWYLDNEFTDKWNFDVNRLRNDISLYAKYTLDGADIYYLNDLHGAIEQDLIANELGVAYISNYLKTKKAARPDNTVIIAGGDMYQGSALSYQEHGKWTLDMLNEMGIDCFVIGNHEFDWGISEILRYHDGDSSNGEANFPLLAANIFYKNTDDLLENTVPYLILDRGDKKIGIIGTIGYNLESSIIAYNIEDYEFGRPQDAIALYAPLLRNEGCDIIISASHDSGDYTNSIISAYEGDKKIDLILNAHDHYMRAERINGIPVLEAGSDGRAVGQILFTFDVDGNITKATAQNVTTDILLNTADLAVEALVDRDKDRLDAEYAPIIIGTEYNGISRTELSEWISKLMAISTGSVAGFQNSGGTREAIAPYEGINGYKIFDILPFDNVVITLELHRSDFERFVDEYGYDTKYIGDTGKIDPNGLYKIATNDYVYYRSRILQNSGINININTNLVLRDLMRNELELQSIVESYFSVYNTIRTRYNENLLRQIFPNLPKFGKK